MNDVNKNFGSRRAQTATELAVFGAILLFVIGLIVQQAMSFGHIQNQNLKALRMAMKLSYEHSSGFRGGAVAGGIDGNKSRNFSSIMLLEDRLAVDSGKHAALSRTPTIASGTGTHSRNYFMQTFANEMHQIPKADFFINGKHFVFTTSAFKTICLTQAESQCPLSYDEWIGNLYPGFGGSYWEPNCVLRQPPGLPDETYGCARLFAFTPNNNQEAGWCDSSPPPCPNGWSLSERFDLDRDGTTDVPSSLYDDFAWQWILVSAFDLDAQVSAGAPLTLLIGDGIAFGEEEGVNARNLSLDVDNDLFEETIIGNDPEGAISPVYIVNQRTGVIESMMVMDPNDGDIDFSYDTSDYNAWMNCFNGCGATPSCETSCISNGIMPPPGVMKEMSMFTRVRPGTFLEIREGKLYSPSNQFVRSIQRKDHIDIIQRAIQLSNDTGRFCSGGTPNNDPNIWWDASNPVEVCSSDCFTPGNVSKICYDTDDLRIFVRSRVSDEFGHQWVTDVSSDPYVNFSVPSP